MDIWNSFEATFTPFPYTLEETSKEEFMEELAEALYDDDVFPFECLLAWSVDHYSIIFAASVNPKEVIPRLAEIIAGCDGRGEITTKYVCSIMDIHD